MENTVPSCASLGGSYESGVQKVMGVGRRSLWKPNTQKYLFLFSGLLQDFNLFKPDAWGCFPCQQLNVWWSWGKERKTSQKCWIDSCDFLAMTAETELLRAKTRVEQRRASVCAKGINTREQWKTIGRCRGILSKLQHWKGSLSRLSMLLTYTVPWVRVLRGYSSVCHSTEEHLWAGSCSLLAIVSLE